MRNSDAFSLLKQQLKLSLLLSSPVALLQVSPPAGNRSVQAVDYLDIVSRLQVSRCVTQGAFFPLSPGCSRLAKRPPIIFSLAQKPSGGTRVLRPRPEFPGRPRNQGYGGQGNHGNQRSGGYSGNSMNESYGRSHHQGGYGNNRTGGGRGGYGNNYNNRQDSGYNRGNNQFRPMDGGYQSYPSNDNRMGGRERGGGGGGYQSHHHNPRLYDANRSRQRQDHEQRDSASSTSVIFDPGAPPSSVLQVIVSELGASALARVKDLVAMATRGSTSVTPAERTEGLSPKDAPQLAPMEWLWSGKTHHRTDRAPAEFGEDDAVSR
ncbi:hypothetical protein RRG08_042571 [Elysia crispata]|uniref:Uncharacterized protein n=1 Tax=Elysia crispata TaxID=231223 RepID=A0AAE0XPY8_9GAST|nr:hypothetical protein RRG08_042571 [Elysia crispata]